MRSSPSLPAAVSRRPSATIPPPERRVIRRDGSTVPWDPTRITRAIALAFYEVAQGTTRNPHRDAAAAGYGLDPARFRQAQAIAGRAARTLELVYRAGRHPTIEEIQDTVEKAIAAEGE